MDRPLPPPRPVDVPDAPLPRDPAPAPVPPPTVPLPAAPPPVNPLRSDLSALPVDPPPVRVDPVARIAPESHMLPPHVGKAGRIGDHLAALSADLREWTELQIALVQRKVEGVVGIFERIQHLLPALKFYIPAAVLAVVGALFVLVTLAIGLGALIGAYWAGFLIVTLLLLLVAGVLVAMGNRTRKTIEAEVAAAKRDRRAERKVDLDDVRDAQRASVRQSVS